ncbi:MAG: PIG-L family deacetylase [Vicinamibacterales bacterium]
MRHRTRPVIITAVLALLFTALIPGRATVEAQNRKNFSIVDPDQGHIALGLAIRKLGVSATFMQAPAHPDDETNALFAMFTHGMGIRSVDVQNNRGDGGQNEIGPELFRDIGVLRTAELLAAHRIDGAEQYFTRAIDYGYSFSPQEVIDKWGRQDIVGDYVRLIRTLRPDVIVTMNIQGGGGDRAHEATTLLVQEAFRAAGDPARYPDQIREGLRPWQAKKLYFSGGGGGRGGRGGPGGGGGATAAGADRVAAQPALTHVCRIDTGIYDELLGRTYAEIGTDAHSNHKCQGTGGLPPLPGLARGGRGGRGGFGGRGGAGGGLTYTLMDTTLPGQKDVDETSFFDGIDIHLAALAGYAGANPPAALTQGLKAVADAAARAKQAFDAGNDAGTAAPIEAGLTALRQLRSGLAGMGLSDDARYEIDFRLRTKERDYEDAVIAAHGLALDAVADDGLVIGGQPIGLTFVASNRGATDVSVDRVEIQGFAGAAACAAGTATPNGVYTCTSDATIPRDAKPTEPYFHDTYWKNPSSQAIYTFDPGVPFGVPFAPSPFRVTFHLTAGGVKVTKEMPVEFRYVQDLYFGDKRMEITVEPAFSVRVTPTLAVIPASADGAAAPVGRDVFVSVTNSTKGAAQTTVALTAPAGWTVTPATAPIAFEKEDESLSARFHVTAPAGVKNGTYALKAAVTSSVTGTEKFTDGYQAIEYPHIARRQVIKPAETTVEVLDVVTRPGLNVGYIEGVGDQVPPAIEQLGAKVTFIDTDELAWGDLSKYDVIMTGVRAYERRDDLRAYNRRLIDYASAGGTVIVQYNKMEFNDAQYGPYPAVVGRGRVADEDVPVKILVPNSPVFNTPNEIGPLTWQHWTQERGLYFLGEKDPRYTDLISMTDSFPDNPGEKLGSLVEAKVGQGRWLYVGLGLWRQLPAATPGAYQLLANLISLK